MTDSPGLRATIDEETDDGGPRAGGRDEPGDGLSGAADAAGRWVFRLALGLTLVPFVVAAVHLTVRYGGDYAPSGDMAMLELLTRDVGHRAVLLGPFSRDGWHHPGPATFYVFALPYRLLGSTSTAMDVAALTVNALAVTGMAVLARRRGGTALALVTLLGCALLMRSLGPDEMRLPWNPFVTVLPYGLMVFATWSLMARDRWVLPVAVFVASFLAQTHIGYVALALPLLVLGTGWLVVSTGRGQSMPAGEDDASGREGDADQAAGAGPGGLRSLVGPALVSAGVGVVLWIGPLIEQLTNDPGNLRLAYRWFREGGASGQPAQGWDAGWRIAASQYELKPEWLIGSRGTTPSGEPPYMYDRVVPVLLVVLVGVLVWLWRSSLPGARPLAVVWGAATLAGMAATARIIGPVYTYRDGWAEVLGMVAGVMLAWLVWAAVARRWEGSRRRVLVPVALVALIGIAIASSVGHVRAGLPQETLSTHVTGVLPATLDALPEGDGPVLVDGRNSFLGLVQAPALVLQLERRGIDAVLPSDDTAAGKHRAHDGGPVRARVIPATGPAVPALAADDSLTLVAYSGELTMDEVVDRLARQQPLDDPEALAVFLGPPD